MWTVQNGIFATVHDANGGRIATIAASINEHETARLIAAAPDLLAALRCALADLEGALQAHHDGDPHGHDWKAHALSIDEARAAIAKATGEQS